MAISSKIQFREFIFGVDAQLGNQRLARIADPTVDSAEMIEISENLHRAELSELEKSVQTANWLRLTSVNLRAKEKLAVATCDSQLSPSGKRLAPQNKPSGLREAAKALGIHKDAAHRAVKIASLSPEAKKLAKKPDRLHDHRLPGGAAPG